jgi:hypothetical protein
MKKKLSIFLLTLFLTSEIYAQFGIKAGVNMANEIASVGKSNFSDGLKNSLTGFQFGVVYQLMPKKSGFGGEIEAILTQKGSSIDSTNHVYTIAQGYKEMTYFEVPLNLRYRKMIGFIGIYGFAGLYGGYELSSITVDEITNIVDNGTYTSFIDHLDYGYNVGLGIELFKKVQLGATFSQGIKNIVTSNSVLPLSISTTNRVFSVNLIYILK